MRKTHTGHVLSFSFYLLVFASLLIHSNPAKAEILEGVFQAAWGDGKPRDARKSIFKFTLAQGNAVKVSLNIKPSVLESFGGLEKLNNKRVIIDVVDQSSQLGELRKARRVKVIKLNPADSDVGGSVQPLAGPQLYVSIMCKFSDKPSEPQDWNYLNDMYGNSIGQLGHYWQEVSSNNMNLTGSRAYGGTAGNNGWYTLPSPRSTYVNAANPDGDLDLLFTDCVGVADAHIDFTNIKGINLIFNDVLGSFAWGGTHIATLDGVNKSWPTTWEPTWGWQNVSIMAHEMGHSFGLPHSNNSDGDADPYDSPWTVMSDTGSYGVPDATYGTRGQHLNAYEKDTLSWLLNSEVFTATDGSVNTVNVDSLSKSVAEAGSYRMIKVPHLSGAGYYTVETRMLSQGADYESSLPGDAIIIHNVIPGRQEPSWVVDEDFPAANYADTNGVKWVVGETFIDAKNNIKISINDVSASGTAYQITVDRTPQPLIVSPEAESILASDVVSFSWSDSGVSVTSWELLVGTSVGVSDIFTYTGTATTVEVTGLPINGESVYVRLRYQVGGIWFELDTSYKTKLPLCPVGKVPSYLLNENFETDLSSWTHGAVQGQGTDAWSYSALGTGHAHGNDESVTSNSFLRSNLILADLQANALLFFKHAYDFESNYDGGVIEYTVDNGANWISAESLFTHNGYNNDSIVGISPSGGAGFSGDSLGYLSSHLDLSSLAGSTVNFRFRVGTDSSVGAPGWDIDDVRVYTCGNPIVPAIFNPAQGATLSGDSESFSWDGNGTSVTQWWLYAGSAQGLHDYYDSHDLGVSTSTTVTGLPVDGSTVYIRLWYKEIIWKHVDYTYTSATQQVFTPSISMPAEGTVLSGTGENFSWNDNGVSVTQWWLHAGSAQGLHDYYDSHNLGTNTSTAVTGLPVDGSTVYIRLWYKEAIWKYVDYTYMSATQVLTPSISMPVEGTVLSGIAESFSWDDNGIAVTQWWLYAGSAQGLHDYYDSHNLGAVTNATVTGLPADDTTVYIRLWYRNTGNWSYIDYTYTSSQ